MYDTEFVREKIKARVKVDEKGCWIWQRTTNEKGYGKMYVDKDHNTKRAHRVSYEVFVGEVQEGFEVEHKCRNRACVNPDHLELVTHKENMGRAVWPKTVDRKRYGVCKRGHILEGDNLVVLNREGYKNPTHTCRICKNARSKEWQRRKKARVALSEP